MKIKLEKVHFIPKELEPNILYFSEEFGAAAHICPCGCGSKIRTPISPVDWSIVEQKNGPTLFPSVGNWQLPCMSHYWIEDGEIVWSEKWNSKQIKEGKLYEQKRIDDYYKKTEKSFLFKLKEKFQSFFRS